MDQFPWADTRMRCFFCDAVCFTNDREFKFCIASCGFDGRRREHGKPNKLNRNLCVTRTLCKEESRTLVKPVTEDGPEITPEREGGRKLKLWAMHIRALSHQILSHPLCAGPWTHSGDAHRGLLTASDKQASREIGRAHV